MTMFPAEVMRSTAERAQTLGAQWVSEMPTRIHSRDVADDGSPQWHPSFARWMTRSQRPPALGGDEAMRATRAFRQLRKVSKREYDVCLRLLVLGDTVEGTTRYLNERAASNGIPLPPGRSQHYKIKDTLALFVAGIDLAYSLY